MNTHDRPARTRRVFIDMDGVTVDFEEHMASTDSTPAQIKARPGSYAAMKPMPNALAAIQQIIDMGFNVWMATKPPTGEPHAYAGKVEWIMEHLPQLIHRIIITHDKGLLGDQNDFLIDDFPHRANCESFQGTLIRFGPAFEVTWADVLSILEKSSRLAVTSAPTTDLDDDDLGSLLRCIDGVERIIARRAFSQSKPNHLFSKQTPRAMTITDAVEIAGPVAHQLRTLLNKISATPLRPTRELTPIEVGALNRALARSVKFIDTPQSESNTTGTEETTHE